MVIVYCDVDVDLAKRCREMVVIEAYHSLQVSAANERML